MEVGELGGKDDAPEESGHDAQCGERDVRPERQAETACHAEDGRDGRLLNLTMKSFVLRRTYSPPTETRSPYLFERF